MAVKVATAVATALTIAVTVGRCHGWLSRAKDINGVSRVIMVARGGCYLPPLKTFRNTESRLSRNDDFGNGWSGDSRVGVHGSE